MKDLGIEVIQKRRELRNLIDQRDAKHRDVNNLNKEIEVRAKELREMEEMVILKRHSNEFIEMIEKRQMTRDDVAVAISKLKDELGDVMDIYMKNRIYGDVILNSRKTGE